MMTKCSNYGEEGCGGDCSPRGLWGIINMATLGAVNESGKPLDPNGPEFKSLPRHLRGG